MSDRYLYMAKARDGLKSHLDAVARGEQPNLPALARDVTALIKKFKDEGFSIYATYPNRIVESISFTRYDDGEIETHLHMES